MSDKFDKMGKNARRFGKTSEKAFKKANKSALNFKSVMGGILAAGGISRGLSLLGSGISTVADEFLGFDNAVTSASAKFKGLDLTTKEGQKTLEELRKTARKVGAETEFNAKQAAEGLDFLALSGMNAEQAMALLPGVTNLATVAQVDLGTATDIATDSLGAFGLMTKDTGQLTTNFNRVQDVMAKTTATSNTNLTDLFEAVQKGAPDFVNAGQSMETFSAMAGIMANAGKKGSEAGTVLRNVMLRLAKPTKEAQEALDALSVTTRDSQGNFRDSVDILADLEKGLVGKGTAEKAAALGTIFGARQTGAITILLKEGTEAIRTYRSELEAAGGSSEKMAEIMRGSLTNQLASLKSAAIEVGFQLFEAFSGEGAGAIQVFTEILRGIDLTPFIEIIKTVVSTAGQLFDKFAQIGESTGLFDKLREAVSEVKPVFETLFDIASTVFNLLSDAGVFDLIAKSFGILIDSVIIFAKVFQWMWTNVAKPVLTAFGELLKPIIEFFTAIADIKGAVFDKIKSVFDEGGAADETAKTLTGAGAALKTAPVAQAPDLTTAAFGPQVIDAPQRRAPNETQTQFNLTRVDFRGQIDIAGAPEGSKAESDNSQVDMRMMGNPRKAA